MFVPIGKVKRPFIIHYVFDIESHIDSENSKNCGGNPDRIAWNSEIWSRAVFNANEYERK